MAWVAVGVGAFSVINGISMAAITSEQADVTRQIDETNAGLMDLDAYHALEQGQTDTGRYDTTVKRTLATQQNAMAADGVDVNSGSAAEEQTETKLTGLLNALDIQTQARAKAYGIQTSANNLRLQGVTSQLQGRSTAYGQAAGGAITGGGLIAQGLENQYGKTKGATGYKEA